MTQADKTKLRSAFRSDLRGRIVAACIEATDFNVRISHKDALAFFDHEEGEIAWFVADNILTMMPRPHDSGFSLGRQE